MGRTAGEKQLRAAGEHLLANLTVTILLQQVGSVGWDYGVMPGSFPVAEVSPHTLRRPQTRPRRLEILRLRKETQNGPFEPLPTWFKRPFSPNPPGLGHYYQYSPDTHSRDILVPDPAPIPQLSNESFRLHYSSASRPGNFSCF